MCLRKIDKAKKKKTREIKKLTLRFVLEKPGKSAISDSISCRRGRLSQDIS